MAAHQDPANENPNSQSPAQREVEVEETRSNQAAEGTQSAEDAAQTAAGLDPVEALQARLAQLEAEKAELNEQVLRAIAETENIRRRAADDVAKARKFGIESFAESLVPVKDSLEAALALTDQTSEAWREGVETTLRQLSNAFERHRLVAIDPAQGDRFDPHLHQAISSIPAEQPSNTVVQVLQKGYLIADRVLRPALVTVAA